MKTFLGIYERYRTAGMDTRHVRHGQVTLWSQITATKARPPARFSTSLTSLPHQTNTMTDNGSASTLNS